MLTVALVLAVAVTVGAVWAWRHAERDLTAAEQRADFHEARALEAERERDALAAELDALSIAGPPAAVLAALAPDDPSLLPAEIEQWLRERTN